MAMVPIDPHCADKSMSTVLVFSCVYDEESESITVYSGVTDSVVRIGLDTAMNCKFSQSVSCARSWDTDTPTMWPGPVCFDGNTKFNVEPVVHASPLYIYIFYLVLMFFFVCRCRIAFSTLDLIVLTVYERV